ncbi:hypothetical protein [Cohnella sp. OV330]|uniref:hypothetical protein n=1 Tax=Cohnella sp. OV330 TaxID=1855288 RepID=UPI0013142164|nr:hypothetical protein [Cohnella sp. OV330]
MPHNDRYHLFYIRITPGASRWNGISMAVSDDLLHWKEHGPILEKHPDAEWLGTGMVQRVGDTFIMNYSEELVRGHQQIRFARSEDLYNWERIEEVVLRPDPAYYLDDPEDCCEELPRWDSLGIVNALQDAPPPYTGFLTAHAADRKLKAKAGVLGVMTSMDGIHWEALPPGTPADLFPNFEVPEHLSFNDRHYVMFSTVTQHGWRYDDRALARSGGTYYVVSDKLQGPYRLPPEDPMLIGSRDHANVVMAYVGRVIPFESGYLFYHFWGNDHIDGRVGLPKRIVEREPWVLKLEYWEGCEAVKGKLLGSGISFSAYRVLRQPGRLPTVVWHSPDDQTLTFGNQGSTGGIECALDHTPSPTADVTDWSDGRVVEYKVTVREGTGIGVFLGERRFCLFLNFKHNRLELGDVKNGWALPNVLEITANKPWTLAYNAEYDLKVFARNECVELFINNDYAISYRLDEPLTLSSLGFYSEDSSGVVSELKIWEMK